MLDRLRAFWIALGDGTTAAERGNRLLRDNLTARQLEQYDGCRCFEVVGGQTGRRYRVHFANAINVDELDAEGRCIKKLCFRPEGYLVMGDILLAQKIALEVYEADALAV